ncbi:hypothetical protein SAY86_027382 [Trapa natans]|uniref:Uncharacterized protein n=1 Tax=Trapa natans TaxID=22666 RepID=A0AAN7QIT2_TRANT|nr:hypothetical protein SAY86_027382 [Trapa natans]
MQSLDIQFSSISIHGNSNNDYLQQHLHGIAGQREELQHMEIDLRAQMIIWSEITNMRKSFETQVKEHADAVVKLQEQFHEKEQIIHHLEKKMEDKDNEILAIKRDNEAALAKEDLLREQMKELATFRRERDHSEAERLQHLKQIHDLQEHLQDKEKQIIEMQDGEMDALQSHSLQAELRDLTEQYNHLWLGFQTQFMEMERFHLHTIQQLQLELAEVRDRCGTHAGESHVSQVKSNEISCFGHHNGAQRDTNGSSRKSGTLSYGNSDNSLVASNGIMSDYRSPSVTSINNETGAKNSTGSVVSEPFISVRQVNLMGAGAAIKTPEHNLLD